MSDPETIVEQIQPDSPDALVEAVDEGDLQLEYPLGTVNLKENQRRLFELHRWYNRGKFHSLKRASAKKRGVSTGSSSPKSNIVTT